MVSHFLAQYNVFHTRSQIGGVQPKTKNEAQNTSRHGKATCQLEPYIHLSHHLRFHKKGIFKIQTFYAIFQGKSIAIS